MVEKHIVSAFDEDIENIQSTLMKMGGLVEKSLFDASEALVKSDLNLAKLVRENDRTIDEMEEEINAQTARLIALRSPIATDLRDALSFIKIASNLERIGDYGKNMAKRSLVMKPSSINEQGCRSLKRMTKEVISMMNNGLDAYIRKDVNLAESVILQDQDIDQHYNALFREFLTFMMENPKNITTCMHLHFIAKNIERVGDHITSIAEQAIYVATGEYPSDDRPKVDATADIKGNN
ncbi:MAG: phosphate transport system regulatory protein PhoU [Rhodobacterales bacterium]|nr:phosphate transport system regulatory protein PhoU [Rhodobacterales bacterium]NCX69600.1 phosphate transport system regulatory protein PhoU [Paracoccaceae bacterium]